MSLSQGLQPNEQQATKAFIFLCCWYNCRVASRMTALHAPQQCNSIWVSAFLLSSLCSFPEQYFCIPFEQIVPAFTFCTLLFCIWVKALQSGIPCSTLAASCYDYSFMYIKRWITLELWGSCPWSQTSSPGPLSSSRHHPMRACLPLHKQVEICSAELQGVYYTTCLPYISQDLQLMVMGTAAGVEYHFFFFFLNGSLLLHLIALSSACINIYINIYIYTYIYIQWT